MAGDETAASSLSAMMMGTTEDDSAEEAQETFVIFVLVGVFLFTATMITVAVLLMNRGDDGGDTLIPDHFPSPRHTATTKGGSSLTPGGKTSAATQSSKRYGRQSTRPITTTSPWGGATSHLFTGLVTAVVTFDFPTWDVPSTPKPTTRGATSRRPPPAASTTRKGGSGHTQKHLKFESLLCFVERYAQTDTKYPPDGLCDFVSLLVKMESNAVVFPYPSQDPLPKFSAAARSSNSTGYGIHVQETNAASALSQLKTSAGSNALHSLWKDKIWHYGCLDWSTYRSPKDVIGNLLTTFRQLQQRFKGGSAEPAAYIFLAFEPVIGQHLGAVQSAIADLFGLVNPDGVIFKTVGEYGTPQSCKVTAASLYKDPPLPDQPVMENVKIIKSGEELESLRDTPPFFNLQVGVLVHTAYGGNAYTDADVIGARCNHTFTAPRQWSCKQAGTIRQDDTYAVRYLLRKDLNQLGVFDDQDTYRKKMCWVGRLLGHSGGWALSNVEFSDADDACGQGSFAAIRWVKQHVGERFGSC